MATGFTDEETKASIDRFLLRQLSMGTLSTGTRDVRALRSTVYDLVSSALLLRPDSFFYAVRLAVNRLAGLVIKQIAVCDVLDAYGPGITRSARAINNTTELTNARAALLELNAGLGIRLDGVSGSIGPAVDRFRRSIAAFLNDEIVKNVVVSGLATETADGLKLKVAELWAGALDTHLEILTLSSSTVGALTALSGTRLPQSSVQSIATKAQTRLTELESTLSGSSGVQQSKTAMLDLLTMRSLLTRAASFRAPTLRLMPLTGDPTQLTFVDSGGGEATLLGTASAPFSYPAGAALDLVVNGVPITIPLPRDSAAVARSRAIVDLSPALVDVTIALDRGAPVTYAAAIPASSDGLAAALALSVLLAGSASVTWDAGASQIVFQSLDASDESYIQFFAATANESAFIQWAGVALVNAPNPPTAEEIVTSISGSTSLVNASVAETFYGTFHGNSVGDDVLWCQVAAGADLVLVATSTTATTATKNLTALGVVAGMYVQVTAPPACVGTYRIDSVSGGDLVLGSLPAGSGTASFFVGVDYSVATGATAQVVSLTAPVNTGSYRVSSGGVGQIILDRMLPVADASLLVAVTQRSLRLQARGTTTSSQIMVTNVNPFGFTVSSSEVAGLLKLDLVGSGDFLFRGVRAGDLAYLVSPTQVQYTRLVASATNTAIVLTSAVPYEAGNWGYEIQSARVWSYIALTEGPASPNIGEFFSVPQVTNFAAFDALIGQLTRGARYSGPIQQAVASYRSGLAELLVALEMYYVPVEHSINNIVQTLREQGLDRALDLFLSLQIGEFFSMDPEGVSYATWLTTNAARAAREVAPVSKLARGQGIVQEWRRLSFQVNPLELR